jgi:hypothetical protein
MKNKILFYTIFFIICFILCLPNIANICRIFPSLGFDNQALLYWKYAASTGIQPYKDIFYPYGLLSYFNGQNSIFTITYLFIAPLSLFGIYFVFKNVFKNTIYSLTAWVFFYLFILLITGFDNFSRYGSLTCMALFQVFLFANPKWASKKYVISYGLLTGFLFPLINDIGFYIPVIFILMSLTHTILVNKNTMYRIIQKTAQDTAIFLIGFLVGCIPFIVYLLYTNALLDFLNSLLLLRSIAEFAKTPFFHSIFSANNLFVLLLLFSTITYFCIKVFLKSGKVTQNTYLQVILVYLLILLEQKNIIRSVDTQITFIGFLLFCSLFYDLATVFKRNSVSKYQQIAYFINLAIIILFVIGLRQMEGSIPLSDLPKQVYLAYTTISTNNCVSLNLEHYKKENQDRITVINQLKTYPDFNGKVYSFPGEPVFYVLLHQKPPYYPSLYEATPLSSQRKLITYLENDDIKYVIYNTKVQAIQDGVPDVLRGRLLYNYIHAHYNVIDEKKGYRILKKMNKIDY